MDISITQYYFKAVRELKTYNKWVNSTTFLLFLICRELQNNKGYFDYSDLIDVTNDYRSNLGSKFIKPLLDAGVFQLSGKHKAKNKFRLSRNGHYIYGRYTSLITLYKSKEITFYS
jgi:hypothetical protein